MNDDAEGGGRPRLPRPFAVVTSPVKSIQSGKVQGTYPIPLHTKTQLGGSSFARCSHNPCLWTKFSTTVRLQMVRHKPE